MGVGALGVAAVQGDGREAAKSCKSLSREGPPTANRVSPFHSVSPMPQGWKERAPPLLIQNANGPLEPLRDRLETPSPFARSEVVTTPHHTDGREVLGFPASDLGQWSAELVEGDVVLVGFEWKGPRGTVEAEVEVGMKTPATLDVSSKVKLRALSR